LVGFEFFTKFIILHVYLDWQVTIQVTLSYNYFLEGILNNIRTYNV